MPVDAFPAVPGRPSDVARPRRRHPRARRTGPLVSTLARIALALISVVACGGAATPTRPAGPAPRRGGDACSLLSAADLGSLGVSGVGTARTYTSGSEPSYTCTWLVGVYEGALYLGYTPSFPAARSYVGYKFVLPPITVPGVGDHALGQFASAFAAISFAKGSTLVDIELFGPSAQGSKTALIAIARKVASDL